MAEDIDITGSSGEQPEMDFELSTIFNGYARGDSVAEIADALPGEKSEQYVYTRLRELPAEYEKAKLKREQVRGIKLRRAEALADNIILTKLENISIEDAKALNTKQLKQIADIARSIGERANLAEGKATSIVEDRVEPTAAEWEAFWTQKQLAGDGIDRESVNT